MTTDKIIDYLQQLDLSDVEAKLYLTLLSNGPISVRELAETIQIKRTTAYFYVDLLIEKGLIIKLVKGSKKLVAAADPEKGLKELVVKEVQKAKDVETNFPDILKTLQNTFPETNGTNGAEIRYYKGKAGIRKIYEEALQSKEFRSFVTFVDTISAFPDTASVFNYALKQNPAMYMKEIIDNYPAAEKEIQILSANKNYSYKLMPKEMKFSSQDILIFDGNVAVVNIKDKINGVVLQNYDLYNNIKVLFDFIWRSLPNAE